MNSIHAEIIFLHRCWESGQLAPKRPNAGRNIKEQKILSAITAAIDDSISPGMNIFSFAECEALHHFVCRSNSNAGNAMSIHLLNSGAAAPSLGIWRALRMLGKWFESSMETLATWKSRSRERDLLAQMSDRELKDIGASRYDAEMEVRKPFWRP
jgi:uncharacterized protein YjiS (DUF1127 family)